jgi:hypothetical protein
MTLMTGTAFVIKSVSLMTITLCLIFLLIYADKKSTESLWRQKGAEEAARDISQNKVYFHVYGKRDHRVNIDAEYGVLFKTVGGCLVDKEFIERTAGYNDAVSEWLGKGGKPINSYADHKPFVCADENIIMKAWESSPSIEITDGYKDAFSDLVVGVRRIDLHSVTPYDYNVIEIRHNDRSDEVNAFGATTLNNVKIKRDGRVPYLLYLEADYFDDKKYRGIMLYDFREMMMLNFFNKELH